MVVHPSQELARRLSFVPADHLLKLFTADLLIKILEPCNINDLWNAKAADFGVKVFTVLICTADHG